MKKIEGYGFRLRPQYIMFLLMLFTQFDRGESLAHQDEFTKVDGDCHNPNHSIRLAHPGFKGCGEPIRVIWGHLEILSRRLATPGIISEKRVTFSVGSVENRALFPP